MNQASATLGDVPVVRREHPPGAKGAKVSLEACAERVRADYMDELVVAFARRTLAEAGAPRDVRRKSQVLLDVLRKRAPYVLDPTNGEYIASARLILCLDSTQKDLCHAGGDCFPQGTLLLRDDFELVPIEEIRVGDRIWGNEKWTRVEGKKFKGPLKVDAIEMNNGSTVCLTGDHKVYVAKCAHGERSCLQCHGAEKLLSYERIDVHSLAEGDTLLRPDRISFGSLRPDPDRLYVEALALADGWANDPGTGRIRDFRIAGRDVLGERARFKHLETINLDEAAAAAALRGIMADSTQNTRSSSRTYSTTSRTLMIQCRVLYRMFGISTGVSFFTPERHGGAGKHPMWRLGTRARSEDSSRAEWSLKVRSIHRSTRMAPCWDIQTEDHYVYLPEHDVTVSNCDELASTFCSLAMATGIDAVLVAQSFSNSRVPTHVLAAVFDPSTETWLKVDPSSATFPVGKCYPATHEVEVDPLTGKIPDFDGPAPPASFVGIGAGEFHGPPLRRRQHPLLGDTVMQQAAALGIQKLQDAVTGLTDAYFALSGAYVTLTATRGKLRPGNPYDPVDPSIISLATLPEVPVFTNVVDALVQTLMQSMQKAILVGRQALEGSRKIYFDPRVQDFFVASESSDAWKIVSLANPAASTINAGQAVAHAILGFFDGSGNAQPSVDTAGNAVSAATTAAALSASPIAAPPTSAQVSALDTSATSTIAGYPPRAILVRAAGAMGQGGPGEAVVVVALIVIGAVIISVGVYYGLKALAEVAKTYLEEVTNRDLASCVASGKCPPELYTSLMNARNVERQTEVEREKNDPFARSIQSVSSVVGALTFGAVAIGGLLLAKTIIDRMPAKPAAKSR
jgi:hypothetical protein